MSDSASPISPPPKPPERQAEIREQLRSAPPELRGYVAGVVALLRADPSIGTAAFPVVSGPAYRTVVFPEGRAFLDYQVVEERRLVVPPARAAQGAVAGTLAPPTCPPSSTSAGRGLGPTPAGSPRAVV
jgi:hypothetical protein